MRPQIGKTVRVLDRPHGEAGAELWTVWSQSPTGWWLFLVDDDGETVYVDVPARLLVPAREVAQR